MKSIILAAFAAVTLLVAMPNQSEARPWGYGVRPRPYRAYYARPYVAPYRVYARPYVYGAYRPYAYRSFAPGYYYAPGVSIGVY
jgi:hypothetical protein